MRKETINKPFIKNATDWIVDKIFQEGASIKILDEGVFSVEAFWGDIIKYTEKRGFDPDILSKFLQKDPQLIKKIKETIHSFFLILLIKSYALFNLAQDASGDEVPPRTIQSPNVSKKPNDAFKDELLSI